MGFETARRSEPLADRRIYTSTEPGTAGAIAAAEQVADSIVGRATQDAVDEIVGAGLEVRDIRGAGEVESDFNSKRINIVAEDDVVTFPAVF